MTLLLGLLITGCATRRPVKPLPPAPSPVVKPVNIDALTAAIDDKRMMAHIEKLAGEIGVRRSGTAGEQAAVAYVTRELRQDGYEVQTTRVPLANGLTSTNVYAELPGKSPRVMLIGAHLDSKPPAPGANDNASGVAVVLELARVLHGTTPPYRCRFVAFGAEEYIDRLKQGHHHFGSRAMAGDPTLIASLHSMTALDMVGVGTQLHIDTTGTGPERWRDAIGRLATAQSLPAIVGHGKPFSDHEAFEGHGIPVAYLHWEKDTTYHTKADKPAHIQRQRLEQTGRLMVRAIMAAQ